MSLDLAEVQAPPTNMKVPWGRVFAALAVPVLLAGVVYAVFLVAQSRQGLPTWSDFACESLAVPGTEASAHLSAVDNTSRHVQVSSLLRVTMPQESFLAQKILASPADPNHRAVMRCLLGRDRSNSRSELRTALPRIQVTGGKVVVEDYVYGRVYGTPNTSVGMVGVTADEHGMWRLRFRPPPVLAQAKWTQISIEAPAGWSALPSPWPPLDRDATKTTWKPAEQAQDVNQISMTLMPDVATRARIVAPFVFPWSLGYYGLFHLITVLMPFLVYLHLRRPPVGATDEFLEWKHEATRLVVPVFWIGGFAVLSNTTTAMMHGVTGLKSWWPLYTLAEATLALLVVAKCAVRWRARTAPVLIFVLIGFVILMMFFLAPLIEWTDVARDGPVRLTLKIAFVLVLLSVFAAGVVQAVREARNLDGTAWKVTFVWLAAAGMAATIVADRLVTDIIITRRAMWTSPSPQDAVAMCCTFEWYPGTLIRSASGWLACLLAVIVWGLVRSHLNQAVQVDERWVKVNLGVIFLLVVLDRGFQLGHWYLPLWFVLGWVALRYLVRFKSPLDELIGPGDAKVRDVLQGISVEDLRQRAKDWQVYIRRAKSAELAFADGSIERTEYYDRVRDPASGLWLLLGRLTPVDALLARGPSAEIMGNVRYAVRYALVLGLPLELVIYLWEFPNQFALDQLPDAYLFPVLIKSVTMAVKWFMVGAILGALWTYLPGKRGPVKVMPLVLVYIVVNLAGIGIGQLTGDIVPASKVVNGAVFFVVLTLIGMLMDFASLRPTSPAWVRPRHALLAVYGLQNLAGQLTFVLAQAGAVLAIVAFLQGSPAPPAHPSGDTLTTLR
ncbi:DUF6185 family protein [Lentzea sp. NPDC051838]|uniref:DUF6185 family protein n=1 Tax=Lentzea sp. NPDC051838 TaxID=3154849 RepID=UPI003448301F